MACDNPTILIDWNEMVNRDVSPDTTHIDSDVVETCACQCLLLDQSFDVFVVLGQTG